jgi:uncharacterized protein
MGTMDNGDENDPIRYDRWIEDALRSVISQALTFTAENGLVGDHHFYITFRTNTDLVTMPDFLKAQHPEEMTIVIQHQYEDLMVEGEGFFTTLRFNGKPERLFIPFSEITGFTDPSVNFGLQLKTAELDEDDLDELEDFPFEPAAVEQDFEPTEPTPLNASTGSERAESDSESDDEQKTGEVIALDAFRKK